LIGNTQKKRNKRPKGVKKGAVSFCMWSIYFSTNVYVPSKMFFL